MIRPGKANEELLRNLDTGQPIAEIRPRLVTANAYLGAQGIATALADGADLVITGRVADPSLTVGPCAQAFGWSWDNWDRLAGATVAGHLIECGTQVTGGISTDWLQMPGLEHIGFPIVEVREDGSCTVTKPRGSGGRVCLQTVKEQLVYEIGDPDTYLSPDVTVSFLSLQVDEEGTDRVYVRGVRGRSAPPTYKVSATYQDGFRAQGQLTMFGTDAVAKAQRAAQLLLQRLRNQGVSLGESVVECLGTGISQPVQIDRVLSESLQETVLRIAVAADSREALERFGRELTTLITTGPQGTTGYAEGRPRVHPLFRFWPCLIERNQVRPQVAVLPPVGPAASQDKTAGTWKPGPFSESVRIEETATSQIPLRKDRRRRPQRLGDIAYARSGDKGIHVNIGVIARRSADYPRLCREVTAPAVASYFGIADPRRVIRYELPNLAGLNFVIHGFLANPLRVDAQGKAAGQALLEMPLKEVREGNF